MTDEMDLQGAATELERIEATHGARVKSLGLTAVFNQLRQIAALLVRKEEEAVASNQRLSTLTAAIADGERHLGALEERLVERREEVASEERRLSERTAELRSTGERLAEELADRRTAHLSALVALDEEVVAHQAALDRVKAEIRVMLDRVDRVLEPKPKKEADDRDDLRVG